MAVLNDFGEAAYQRVTQQATDLANRLGIQPEIIIQYFNDTAHFPQTLQELERWGDTPDKEYGFRRRQPNGVWTPIMQGVTPGKAENDPGFKHRITNEVGKIQRFQEVDPSGNVWGGSWDPEYNKAHPELAGKSGYDTAQQGLRAASAAGSGAPAGSYQTKNGPRSIGQMKSELLMAGYGGPYDDPAIVEAYKRTTGGDVTPGGGGSSGGGGGINDLINAGLYGNEQEFGLKKNADTRAQQAQDFSQQHTRDARYDALRAAELGRYDQNRQFDLSRYDANANNTLNRFENRRTTEEGRLDSRLNTQLSNQQFQQGRFDTQRQNDRSLYSSLAQALLGSAVELGSRPRDWVKYNQMLSGGKDITQQLFGDQPRADFSGFTGGEPEAGRVTDILSALGLPQLPGGSVGQGSADAERAWLGQQGVSALGNRDFFGAGADARENQWMGSRVGAAPEIGPEPYTPPPDLPMMPSTSDYREAATASVPRLKQAYADALKQYGVEYLSRDDPRLLRIYQAETGLDEAASRFVADKASEYYSATGRTMPDAVLAGYINDAHSQSFNTDPARGRARAVAGGYDAAVGRAGQMLGATDPRTLQQYQDIGGLDPSSALDASRRMSQYAGATGRRPTTGELMRTIEEARTRGAPRPSAPGFGAAPSAGGDPLMPTSPRRRASFAFA